MVPVEDDDEDDDDDDEEEEYVARLRCQANRRRGEVNSLLRWFK